MARRTFLRIAREAAGFKRASDFANAYGLPETTYRSHDNGHRGITVRAAKVYAKLLLKKVPWVTWQYLVNGDRSAGELTAEVLGLVGAGEVIIPVDDPGAWDPILAPPGMIDPAVASVRGDSMLPVYRDRDLLFVDLAHKGRSDIVGRDCVVELEEGVRQIKLVKKSPRRGHFRLYSYQTDTESEDVKLLTAVPVLWVQRR